MPSGRRRGNARLPAFPPHTSRPHSEGSSGLRPSGPWESSLLVICCRGALPDELQAVSTHTGMVAPFCLICLPTFFLFLDLVLCLWFSFSPHPGLHLSWLMPLSSSVSSPLILLQLGDSVWVGCGGEAPEPRFHLFSLLDPREGGRQRKWPPSPPKTEEEWDF